MEQHQPQNKKNKKPIKPIQYSNKYCIECYRRGHDNSACYKIKQNLKKKNLSEDKDLLAAEFFNNKVCEIQFGCYDLLMTDYLCQYANFINTQNLVQKMNSAENNSLQAAEFFSKKICESQFSCYDLLISNYLSELIKI